MGSKRGRSSTPRSLSSGSGINALINAMSAASSYYSRSRSRKSDVTMASSRRSGSKRGKSAPSKLPAYSGRRRSLGSFEFKKGGFIKRPPKVPKKSLRKTIGRDGVHSHIEVSGTVASPDTVYIGHTTNPTKHMINVLAVAILKIVSIKIGFPMNSVNQAVGSNLNDSFQLVWKANDDPATSSTTYTFTFATTTSWLNVISDLEAYMLSNWTTDTVLSHMIYYPNTPSAGNLRPMNFVRVNLQNSSITFDAKSNFKMQNRTVDDPTDNQTDDVDKVPLNGKSYEGSGSGSSFNNGTNGARPFYGDRSSGLIKKEGNVDGLNEVPYEFSFPDVKRCGKIRFDPGVLKTSVLTNTQTMSYRKWFALIFGNNVPVYPNRKIGAFRFFCLEKMIGGLSAQNIEVAYEVETQLGCVFKPKGAQYTVTAFTQYNA